MEAKQWLYSKMTVCLKMCVFFPDALSDKWLVTAVINYDPHTPPEAINLSHSHSFAFSRTNEANIPSSVTNNEFIHIKYKS